MSAELKAPQGASLGPVYVGDWAGLDDLTDEFFRAGARGLSYIYVSDEEAAIELSSAMEGVQILFAHYEAADYSGDCFVLFEKAGRLYEVNGSHCSCHGLEGQWEPEETSAEAIRHRITEGSLGYADNDEASYPMRTPFAKELLAVLASIEPR
jgi:hypothetical protein